jgi:hypothetical protein
MCQGYHPITSRAPAWLFADRAGGPKASANLYSLVETGEANGVDAYVF